MVDPEQVWRSNYLHPGQWDSVFKPLSMVEMFEQSVARHPDAPLLEFFGRHYSYREVFDGANRVACGLRNLGYGKGDRIGLFLPNVPHYVAAYYGILKLGGTVVNFSPLYTVDELGAQVLDSGTRALFTISATALLPTALAVLEKSHLDRLVVGSIAGALPPGRSLLYRWFNRRDIAERPHDPRIIAFSRLIDNDGGCQHPDIDPEQDLALIQYTGGTSGTPKGAMLTHQNLSANARQVAMMDPDDGKKLDRIMGVLPFFHVFANTCVLNRTVLTGGEIVMLPRFNAGQVLATLKRTQATTMPGVPTMYQALLDHPEMNREAFASLRFCISGGAPLPAELKTRFEAATGARLLEGYGLSESSGVVSCNPYAGLNKPGTIGQPIVGTHLRLVDKEDPTRPAPDGEPGELVIAGPQIMKGYWNRPENDATVFVDDPATPGFDRHWLRTGDVAEIDADGFVRIVDRLKDMIAVGGFKVFPSQIEAVLYRHPAVKEALVIGVPDTYHGEMPRAYVTLNDGEATNGEQLKAWLNTRVGKHERVDQVVVRLTLPKTLIGKLSRKELIAEVKAEKA